MNFLPAAFLLVKFKLWSGCPADQVLQNQCRGSQLAKECHLVHSVQADVKPFGQCSFNHHIAGNGTHQIAHGTEAAQGDQGAVILVIEFQRCGAIGLGYQTFGQQGRLLMGCLSTGRNGNSSFLLSVRMQLAQSPIE